MASAAFLAVVLAFYMLLATALGLLAGALARRLAPGSRLAAGIRIGVPAFLGAFALVLVAGTALGATTRPDTQAKLAMLDRGGVELVTCAPIAVTATIVGVAAALYLAMRQLGRSATDGE